MLKYRNIVCVSFPERRVDGFRSKLRLAKQRVVPYWRSQAIKADFMYSCYRFRFGCGRPCIPDICGAGHNSKKDVYRQICSNQSSWFCQYTPFSTLIRPRHPLIVLFVSFTRLLWSIFLVGRKATIAWDLFCPTRNRSARWGRPSRSSFSSVMRYRVRGLVLRYRCITRTTGEGSGFGKMPQALISEFVCSWQHLSI